MQSLVTSVPHHLATLFSSRADAVARQAGFVQRSSKLGGSEMARTLVFGWLHNPQATLEELAQMATDLGVTISPQGLEQRFGPGTAEFFQRLLHEAVLRVVSTDPVAIPVLQRFAGGVCLLDRTALPFPPAVAGGLAGCGVAGGKTGGGLQSHMEAVPV